MKNRWKSQSPLGKNKQKLVKIAVHFETYTSDFYLFIFQRWMRSLLEREGRNTKFYARRFCWSYFIMGRGIHQWEKGMPKVETSVRIIANGFETSDDEAIFYLWGDFLRNVELLDL